MNERKLAQLVLQLLDLQKGTLRAYGPHREAIEKETAEAERHIRKVCEKILGPKEEQPGLFGNEKPTAH